MTIETTMKHRYEIASAVEETNASKTFKAQDLTYQRDVFLKAISVPSDAVLAKQVLNAAEAEAKAMIAVGSRSAHVPALYEHFYDEASRTFYIVMQLIQGDTLAERTAAKQIAETEFLSTLMTVCDVLALMKKNNYVHKDLKPANIMISKDEITYLIDFGSSVRGITRAGDGTIGYRAPEMGDRSSITDRSRADIFSIGVMLYEFFTGKRPEEGADYIPASGGKNWRTFVVPREAAPQILAELDALIVKCMACHPHDRCDVYELKNGLNKVRYTLLKNRRRRG